MWQDIAIYIDSSSDTVFWCLTILVCVGIWKGCDLLADWSEGGTHEQHPATRPRVVHRGSPLGRVAQGSAPENLASRFRRRSVELGGPQTSRPMWLADSTDRQPEVGMNGGDAA